MGKKSLETVKRNGGCSNRDKGKFRIRPELTRGDLLGKGGGS